MDNIEEAANKKLKSRIRKIRKCNNHEDEKNKFIEKLGTSFEVEFHNRNPEKLSDGFSIITAHDGKVLLADYFYQVPEEEEYVNIPIEEKDLKAVIKFFEDYRLHFDDLD